MKHNYKRALVESIKEHQEIIQKIRLAIEYGLNVNNPSIDFLNTWKDKMKEAIG